MRVQLVKGPALDEEFFLMPGSLSRVAVPQVFLRRRIANLQGAPRTGWSALHEFLKK